MTCSNNPTKNLGVTYVNLETPRNWTPHSSAMETPASGDPVWHRPKVSVLHTPEHWKRHHHEPQRHRITLQNRQLLSEPANPLRTGSCVRTGKSPQNRRPLSEPVNPLGTGSYSRNRQPLQNRHAENHTEARPLASSPEQLIVGASLFLASRSGMRAITIYGLIICLYK